MLLARKLSVAAFGLTLLGVSMSAMAKRVAPAEVPPLALDRAKLVVRYQHTDTGGAAFVEALDPEAAAPRVRLDPGEKTPGSLWRVQIYTVTYDAHLEIDVQEDYIESLVRHGDAVWITSERGRRYSLDLGTHAVTERK
jgi:hypothetical protein